MCNYIYLHLTIPVYVWMDLYVGLEERVVKAEKREKEERKENAERAKGTAAKTHQRMTH